MHALGEQGKASNQTGAKRCNLGCMPCAFVGRTKGFQEMECNFCHSSVHAEEQRRKKQAATRRRSSEHLAELRQKPSRAPRELRCIRWGRFPLRFGPKFPGPRGPSARSSFSRMAECVSALCCLASASVFAPAGSQSINQSTLEGFRWQITPSAGLLSGFLFCAVECRLQVT